MNRLPLVAALLAATACTSGAPPAAAPPTAAPTTAPSTTAVPITGPPATATPAPSLPAPPTARPAAPPPRGTAVFYLSGPRRGLYREFRDVDGRTIRAAVGAMLRLAPLDPDYVSVWPRGTRVLGVSLHGTVATVDLSRDALGVRADARTERTSLQQLVHTVTAAAPDVTGVRLRVDGRTRPTLWGDVDTSGTIAPDPEALGFIWVVTPAHLATVGRTFTVTGTASTFEANVPWTVTRNGRLLTRGFTTASEGAPGRGDWSVVVTLPPGTTGEVVFEAAETSMVDGGDPMDPETKTFVVR